MADRQNSTGSTGRLEWIRAHFTGKFWFRVSLFGIGALASVLLANQASFLVPEWFVGRIAEGTAKGVLTIIASSMLVVTTFSLGSLVSALAAAAQMATPRAARVLIDDAVSQNVVSTFLGAFVFSMVGIFAISFGYYDPEGEAVLLVAAATVVALVILTLFGWLDYLANMVRLGETIAKIENRARPVIRQNAATPWMGGVALTPGDARGKPLCAGSTGYVRHVDIRKLETLAAEAGSRIAVLGRPGDPADPATPLVLVGWTPNEDETEAILNAFTIDPERSLDQDPRFCLKVLTEIGQRALSPGVNDPGTAIAVIVRQQRLLTEWIDSTPELPAGSVSCPHVAVAPLSPDELLEIALAPIARDGRAQIGVMLRLNLALTSLARLGDTDMARAARHLREKAVKSALDSLDWADDRQQLERADETSRTPPL